MNLRLKYSNRLHIFIFSIFSSLLFANLSTSIEIKRTDTGEKYKDNQEVIVYLDQRLELEVTGYYSNPTSDSSYIHLRDYFVVPTPDFIYNLEKIPKKWLGKIAIPPLTDTVLTQIIYVDRPQELGEFPFSLWSANMGSPDPSAQNGMFSFFTLNFNVKTPPSPPPVLHPEPEFSPGLYNSVFWDPITSANTQDIYAFDILDSLNWQRAIQRIYRMTETDSIQADFQGLEHGHTYGYFSKSTHLIDGDTVALFSETIYSTQDNSPPTEVDRPVALYFNNRVELSWFASDDPVSGVVGYYIYRTRNFENEACLDTIWVQDPDLDAYTWYDTQIDSGNIYIYRTVAFDQVGNRNQGKYSESIRPNHSTGNDPVTPDVPGVIVDPEPVANGFIKSSRDTIFYHPYFQNNQVQRVRLLVARDDSSYFKNKPLSGGRYFDSGWLTPASYKYWIFDYQYLKQIEIDNNGQVIYQDSTAFVDMNFVNGHTYHRRLVVDFGPVQDTLNLSHVIPDCFAPEEVQNLQIQSIVNDANYKDPVHGFTKWQVVLNWSSAFDGASGVARYHIYRKLESIDSDFIELNLNTSEYLKTTYIDSLFPASGLRNPNVIYRVAAEDQVGNLIDISDLTKEVNTLALNPPKYQFNHQNDTNHLFLSDDTLYIDADSVGILLSEFNTNAVEYYYFLMDTIQHRFTFSSQDTFRIPVPAQEFTSIRLRAVYANGESSVWSEDKMVIRAQNSVPLNLQVFTNSNSWDGHIYLEWQKPSFDIKHYEIWREDYNGVSEKVGESISQDDHVQWTDYYQVNELTGDSTDTLIAHDYYQYKVRKVNLFDQITGFSNIEGTYCVKPPVVTHHDIPRIELNKYVFTIYWDRPKPNRYTSNFITRILVSEDSLSQVVKIDTVSENTEYTFYNASIDHNYIFRIQEIPNSNPQSLSNLSRPYTVSSLVKLEPFALIPQPRGKMYVNWNSPELVNKYKVDSYVLYRDSYRWEFPLSTIDFMDSSTVLQHNGVYPYTIYALDSLGQVVAANTKTDTMDTGSVFIPEIKYFPMKYFNDDSIEVIWEWKNRAGGPAGLNNRNADHGILQASVNPNFPDDSLQTTTVFINQLDPNHTSHLIQTPSMLGRVNSQLYFRIAAKDTFDNPVKPVWSTEFFSMKSVLLDTIAPYPVTDLHVAISKNYPFSGDSVIYTLEWTGADVEYPDTSNVLFWDQFVGNIYKYYLYRKQNSNAILIDESCSGNFTGNYSLLDTAQNQLQDWFMVAEDSAGNLTSSALITQPVQMVTPQMLTPLGSRSCEIAPVAPDSAGIEYFIEIAMLKSHFNMAYEIGSQETTERLLCRSGWQESLTFECETGWGEAVVDTTWFRVMARQLWGQVYWESGWSDIAYHVNDPFEMDKEEIALDKPAEFKVHPLYPNPFNGQMNIQYELAEAGEVEIKIFNVLGQVVNVLTQENQTAGNYTASWYGANMHGHAVSSGVYLVQVMQKTDRGSIHVNRLRLLVIK